MYLRKKVAEMKRQKMLFDFASAKHVGVLCSPHDELTTGQVKGFLRYLSQKGIKYSVFGYFDGKEIPENFLYWKEMDFITRQDINFFFIPKNTVVEKFIAEPFDLLINCSINHYFPMEYIAQLSKAKCKVGVKHENETYYDLMIDIQKNKTVDFFLKNLEIYLSNLRHSE